MGAAGVVEGKVFSQTVPSVVDGGVGFEVHVFVFDGPPQPFREDIIHAPSTTVHTDRDIFIQQECSVLRAREVTALIRIMNLRRGFDQRSLQIFQTEIYLERRGQFPSDDVTAEPVEEGD